MIHALVGFVIMVGLGFGVGGENGLEVEAGPVNRLSQDCTTNIALIKVDEVQNSVVYLTVVGAAVLLVLLCACHVKAAHYVLRGRHNDRRAREHLQTEKDRLDKVEGTTENIKWKVERLIQTLGAQRTVSEDDVKELNTGRPAPQSLTEA